MRIVVQDNFYPEPDKVREQALAMFFHPGQMGMQTKFPGQRTRGTFSKENRIYVRNKLSHMLNRNMINFPHNTSNAAFTLGTIRDKSPQNWIHHDATYMDRENRLGGTEYAAVIYLSPEPDPTAGTAFFRSRKSKTIWKTKEVTFDNSTGFKDVWKGHPNFDLHMFSANIYNRAIVYPARYWHAPSNAGWGYDKKTGRLVQVCFFMVERGEYDDRIQQQ